ncbi:MAG: TPM domain-containing protein [Cyanobacteria bacterium J06629_18]
MKKQFFHRYQVLIFAISLIITLIIANIPTHALTVNQVPNPRQQNGGWVTDMVDMLSPQAENQLNQMISNLEKQNGTEIAIVTVPTTKPESTPKAFTTKLFNTWGIGKQGKNNGILFLVSKGDRRTEIETGTGITKILPNAKISGIIKQQVTPQFKKGNFEAGILAGAKSLIKELETNIVKQPQTAVNPQVSNSEVDEQPFNQNPYIHIFWVLLILPVWKFIVLPVTRSISNFFGNIGKFFGNLSKDNLSPSGVTRRKWPYFKKKAYCKQCSKPMEEVEASEVESVLTEPQKVAKKIDSTEFIGWRCPDCSPDGMHLLILQSYKASNCPTCNELTVTDIRTKVIKRATRKSSGIARKWQECQCCDYSTTKDITIPKLSTPNSSGFKSSRNHSATHIHFHNHDYDSDDYSFESCDNSYDSEDYSFESSDDSYDSYDSDDSYETTSYDTEDCSSDDSDFGGGESDGDGGGDDW